MFCGISLSAPRAGKGRRLLLVWELREGVLCAEDKTDGASQAAYECDDRCGGSASGVAHRSSPLRQC
jgi:hypothetical protein